MKDDGNIPTQRVKDYRETGSIPGLVGTTLDGRFRVLRRIAGGATGQVYEALQAPFDRRVAVKVLDIDASADPTFRARFQREASLAARVAHPNIVTIYDYGETPDGQMYMVMELLRGRSLARVLREEGRLHPSHALDIALQMTRALRRAHQHGIVHRDLKPANVVLESSDDASDLVKVLDFGLVKLLEPGRGSDLEGVGERLTAVGAMLGTPGYMSPEQAMGEDVDARTDVYACGVILYELLSGAKPFAGPTVQDVLSKQIMQPVPPIYGLDTSAEAAEATERLIRDCLHPNRAHRPASAEVLLARLKEVWRMESDTAYGTEASFVGPRLPTADISSPSQSLSLEGVLNEELGPPQISIEEPGSRRGTVFVAVLGLVAGLLFALAGVVLWTGPAPAPPEREAKVGPEVVAPAPPPEVAAQPTPEPKTLPPQGSDALAPLPEEPPAEAPKIDDYKANPY